MKQPFGGEAPEPIRHRDSCHHCQPGLSAMQKIPGKSCMRTVEVNWV